MEPMWSVGLMTGTVLDGYIDVALVRTDGETIESFGPDDLVPYPEEINILLNETLAQARDWNFQGPDPEIFSEAEEALTRAQSDAVRQVVEGAGMRISEIGIIGFHGQSVLHRAPTFERLGETRQLGDGTLMSDILQTTVAYDFRTSDMAAGGQGAPLSAIYHKALLETANFPPDTAVLNLGGVANVTYATREGDLIAFDTGPANAPINDLMRAHGLGEMDRDGALAKSGTVDEELLHKALNHPYLSQNYPKSLDRFDFGFDWAMALSPADGAATLTAFTASAVGRGLDLLPDRPDRLIVCGGGRHNPTLMQKLSERAYVTPVLAEEMGWRGDTIEAECFALLAVRRLRDLPISFPTTTGVKHPMTGGKLARVS